MKVKRKDVAIKLTNVSKRYFVHHEKPTLAERLMNGRGEEFWALKDINLTIKKGESVGIVGANGSGKTTLLKLITGITSPTTGDVETNGKVVSLIDLEAGFHQDMTGIDNIFLNGTLLGMNSDEIKSKLKRIVDYADIGKFIDAPLFTYSSGMKLRVGFSVAIHSNPDILILDENVSVGDEKFRKISFATIQNFVKSKKMLLFASHDLDSINIYCRNVIHLDKGRIVQEGSPKKVIGKYKNIVK